MGREGNRIVVGEGKVEMGWVCDDGKWDGNVVIGWKWGIGWKLGMGGYSDGRGMRWD